MDERSRRPAGRRRRAAVAGEAGRGRPPGARGWGGRPVPSATSTGCRTAPRHAAAPMHREWGDCARAGGAARPAAGARTSPSAGGARPLEVRATQDAGAPGGAWGRGRARRGVKTMQEVARAVQGAPVRLEDELADAAHELKVPIAVVLALCAGAAEATSLEALQEDVARIEAQ